MQEAIFNSVTKKDGSYCLLMPYFMKAEKKQ